MNGAFYWQKVRSDRLAFLQNGAAYFPAFVEAVRKAKRAVYIAGWDVDSRVVLTGMGSKHPLRLGEFLDQVAAERPELNIYLLVWDFSILFVAEREPAPIISLGWKRHVRVHYHADGEHPFGASHHQKFVVVDDTLCFAGGMDLAVRRWDRAEHYPDDPERLDPQGEPYDPYHDVHAVFDGEGGAVLGDYFRQRWLRATGKRLEKPDQEIRGPGEDLWPESVPPLCRDVDVYLARTEPRHKGFPEIREVEAMVLETIRRAKKHLYIENQYFSSASVREALVERLREDDCPEILIVLPKKSGSWLARKSMDALRAKTLKDLYEADVNGRLLVCYPACPNGKSTYVHAKLMIADDEFVTVGSANLANRSMGLDTELNIAIEAGSADNAAHIRKCIASFRASLLGEFLHMDSPDVQTYWNEHPSFNLVAGSLGRDGYSLQPVEYDETLAASLEKLNGEDRILDPERPVSLSRMLDLFLAEERRSESREHRKLILKAATMILLVIAGVVVWKFSGLGDDISAESLAGLGGELHDKVWALPVLIGIYSIGGVLMAPITVLIVATALIFSPFLAAVYSMAGCLANAAVTYGLGLMLGSRFVRKLAGKRINELSRRLAHSGVLTVALVRNLPIAPFSVVNMVAGASHIRFWDYLLGTFLGMLPGVIALTVFSGSIINAFREPTWWSVAVPVAAISVFVLFLRLLRKRSGGQEGGESNGDPEETEGRKTS
ncbi:hypothetical protein DPQ33_05955 [Oceanidesulfovibrio indonesiensis]|uniref:PLD phosphodiesterase domain-containing protein n=1 Tax=Oceanidesulfovibrio indonesiensis TaxID=54767 RepID=A0A7M3MGX0_9BACT|nr:VTT domain-containing protein [Oceanidesulfovibrio indonesiensis]TVM18295.1 hypothetical protein DPQ33_05955 [Oceanidesulfovibrio indonesiensis]